MFYYPVQNVGVPENAEILFALVSMLQIGAVVLEIFVDIIGRLLKLKYYYVIIIRVRVATLILDYMYIIFFRTGYLMEIMK